MKTNPQPAWSLLVESSLSRQKATALLKSYQEKKLEVKTQRNWILSSYEQQIRANDEEEKNTYRAIREQETTIGCIETIYRLAEEQFSRLAEREKILTLSDIQELEKWLGRVKTLDGYKDILDALHELNKYRPGSVKNVYALTQKIIIEGAFKKGKRETNISRNRI